MWLRSPGSRHHPTRAVAVKRRSTCKSGDDSLAMATRRFTCEGLVIPSPYAGSPLTRPTSSAQWHGTAKLSYGLDIRCAGQPILADDPANGTGYWKQCPQSPATAGHNVGLPTSTRHTSSLGNALLKPHQNQIAVLQDVPADGPVVVRAHHAVLHQRPAPSPSSTTSLQPASRRR